MTVLTVVALAAVPAPSLAEVPPEAQPAFNKGVLAAQQQDWQVAELSFQEARRSAPDAAELYYNLGLTESKMPGRELRAIAWFGAYLSANPKAGNASAVNALIDQLQVKSESSIIQLITIMQNAARQLPSGEGPAMYHRDDALERVATEWEDFGDFNAAQGVIDSIGVDCCGVRDAAMRELTKARDAPASATTSGVRPPDTCDWAVLVDVESHNDGQWCYEQRNFNNGFWLGPPVGRLNSPPFLNLAGYLSSPPPTGDYDAGDSREPIAAMARAASMLIDADHAINKMILAQRAGGAKRRR